MLILKPDITVYWDNGVSLKANSYMFIDDNAIPNPKYKDMGLCVTISGITEPNVQITCTNIKRIPGAMDAVNAWIDEHNLLTKWREEVAKYNTIMGLVELPGAGIEGGRGFVRYTLTIDSMGVFVLPSLIVTVTVDGNKPQAWVQLQLDTGVTDRDFDPVLCDICTYSLDFPITMDTLKAGMCKPFQQYLDYLQG
jgi:hypothetical protein